MLNRIADLRLALGLHQKDLSDVLGLSQSQVSRIESAPVGILRLGHLLTIAKRLGCTLDALIGRTAASDNTCPAILTEYAAEIIDLIETVRDFIAADDADMNADPLTEIEAYVRMCEAVEAALPILDMRTKAGEAE